MYLKERIQFVFSWKIINRIINQNIQHPVTSGASSSPSSASSDKLRKGRQSHGFLEFQVLKKAVASSLTLGIAGRGRAGPVLAGRVLASDNRRGGSGLVAVVVVAV